MEHLVLLFHLFKRFFLVKAMGLEMHLPASPTGILAIIPQRVLEEWNAMNRCMRRAEWEACTERAFRACGHLTFQRLFSRKCSWSKSRGVSAAQLETVSERKPISLLERVKFLRSES